MFAYDNGYKLTFGDAFRDEDTKVGIPESLHKKRLAIDLNLFKDGKYLKETFHYQLLGQYWESIGGSWGGRFRDGNHFSLKHEGVR